jgi:agmatine deiminase
MTSFLKTPRQLGYSLPAEWEKHDSTWIALPRKDGISFADRFDGIIEVWTQMCEILSHRETVRIVVRDQAQETQGRIALSRSRKIARDNLIFHRWGINECWARDCAPMFVQRSKRSTLSRSNDSTSSVAIVDWQFNGYGGRYSPFDLDDAMPQQAADYLGLPLFSPKLVLEGGAIDVNGRGALLTTESCLLNPNRNPNLTREQVETILCDFLGVTKILWLSGRSIAGDDTDGQVCNLARFVNPNTVVASVEEDPNDENFAPLQENLAQLRRMKDQSGKPLRIVELPMPGVVTIKKQRTPASYANFYIANGVVLLPTYRHKKNDKLAKDILQKLFRTRKVIPIDATEMIWGGGAFHCATQQQPA